MKHSIVRWNPATREHFFANCGRTPDAVSIADAQERLEQYNCDVPSIDVTIPAPGTETTRLILKKVSRKMTYSWQESYQAAVLEADWTKIQERIQRAESEISRSKSDSEWHSLNDALSTLESLRRIAERQNGYQSKGKLIGAENEH